MRIIRTDYSIEFHSEDSQGKFIIRIQKDCSQLQIEIDNDYCFVDVDLDELSAIRDCLTEAIVGKKRLSSP